MAVRIQIRRDVSTSWQSVNPVLAEGELGYETDTGKLKIGDGVTAWNDLPYWGGGGVVSAGGEEGSVQYKASDGGLAGNAYFKYIESDYQLMLDDTSLESVPVTKAAIHVKTKRNYTLVLEHTQGLALLKVISTATDILDRVAGIHLFSGTDSYGVISFATNTLHLSTSATTTAKIALLNRFTVDYNKVQVPVVPPPTDTPQTDYGFLFADNSDKHLKWKTDDGSVYDLCQISSPAGPDKSIQFNSGGSFAGSSNLLWDDANGQLILQGEIKQGKDSPENQFYWVNRFGDTTRAGYIYVYGSIQVLSSSTGSTAFQFDGNTTLIRFYPSVSASSIGTMTHPVLFVDMDDNHIKYKYQDTLWDLTEKATPGGEDNSIQFKSPDGGFAGSKDFKIFPSSAGTPYMLIDTQHSLQSEFQGALQVNNRVDAPGDATGSYDYAFSVTRLTDVEGNVTELIGGTKFKVTYTQSGTLSEGTVSSVEGVVNGASTFTVQNLKILELLPSVQSGIVDSLYTLYLSELQKGTDGSYTDYYALYQADTEATNVLAGKTRFMNDILIKATSSAVDTPPSGYGTLWADSNSHLKWTISDGTTYDLTVGHPGGDTYQVQYNFNGRFEGSPYLVFVAGSKRLGVGLSNPGANLHVKGTSRMQGTFEVVNDSGVRSLGAGDGWVETHVPFAFWSCLSPTAVAVGQVIVWYDNNHLCAKYSDDSIKYLDLTPQGLEGSIQYNSSGEFAGSSVALIQSDSAGEYVEIADPNRSFVGSSGILQVSAKAVASQDASGVYHKASTVSGALNVGSYNLDSGSYLMTLYLTSSVTGSGYLHRAYDCMLQYGIVATSTTVTVDQCYGLYLAPYVRSGTVNNLYDLYIGTTVTGGTVNNHFAIYQADSDAINYYAGVSRFGKNLMLYKTATPDTPLSGFGTLYHDSSDGHLYWLNSNGETFDLCTVKNPGGPDKAVQINNSGNFYGYSGFYVDYTQDPHVIYVRNPNYTLNLNSGILQLENAIIQDSEITDAAWSRSVSFIRRNTLNADVTNGRFSNLWIQHFTQGSGNHYSQINMVCNYGIYATDSTSTVDYATGITITPYVKSGQINTIRGIYLAPVVTGGTFGIYNPIYQDGDYKSIFEGRIGIGSGYVGFTEKLFVQGDVRIKGDDSYFLHTSDSYLGSDDEVYFGVRSADGYIVQGLDYVKFKETTDTTNIPNTPPTGYGALYAYGKHLYWRNSGGDTYRLDMSTVGSLQEERIVATDNSGNLITLDSLSYMSGGGLRWNSCPSRLLTGFTQEQFVFDVGSESDRSIFNFRNIGGTTEVDFGFTVFADNHSTYPATVYIGGTGITTCLVEFPEIVHRTQTQTIYSAGTDTQFKIENQNNYFTFVNSYNDKLLKLLSKDFNSILTIDTSSSIPYIRIGNEGELQRRRAYTQKLTFTVPANTTKWVRIARSGGSGGRNAGIFKIYYTVSGHHGYKWLFASAHFNRSSRMQVGLLGHSRYSSVDAIRQLRILTKDTYDDMFVELHLQNPNSSSAMTVVVELDSISYDGWNLLETAEDGSVPTDYTEHIYDLLNCIFSLSSGDATLFSATTQTVRVGDGNRRDDSNYALSVKGYTEIFTSKETDNYIRTNGSSAAVEKFLSVYSDTTSDKVFGVLFQSNGSTAPMGLVGADFNSSPAKLRIASTGVIELGAGQGDVRANSLTNPAYLETDGTFRAKYFRPTSGYKSVDGSTGVTATVYCDDQESNMKFTLVFKNGILVSVSSSTIA